MTTTLAYYKTNIYEKNYIVFKNFNASRFVFALQVLLVIIFVLWKIVLTAGSVASVNDIDVVGMGSTIATKQTVKFYIRR